MPIPSLRHSALAAILCLIMSQEAFARPGFYLGLGAGPTNVRGQAVPYNNLHADAANTMPPPLTNGDFGTSIAGGPSGLFRMGYNILGYGAIETVLTGHGVELQDDDARAWAAHWHTGARLFPLWYWQTKFPKGLRNLEPSLFFGWGLSYQAYVPPDPTFNEVGWSRWGSWRAGAGLEYYLLSFLTLGVDYNYVHAAYDTFIFNLQDSEKYALNQPAITGYHQIYATLNFHFGLANAPEWNEQKERDARWLSAR